jgi:hypothetical protein
VNRLERAALHIAWRRWPAQLRDERRREWEAELAVLATEPDRGRLARSVGRLRFALSLAWSPPVEDEHGVPRGWHDVLPVLGRGLRSLLALMATALVGWAALVAVDFVVQTAMSVSDGIANAPSRDGVDWFGAGLNVVALTGAIGGTALFGRWLGQHLPMNWAHRGRLSDIGSAVVAPLVLGVLFLVVNRLSTPDIEQGPGVVTYLPPDVLPAVLVWMVVVVVVAVAVVRLARPRPVGGREPERPERPGRPGLAWLVGLGGGTLALSLAGIIAGLRTALRVGLDPATAPLWTPQALLFPHGGGPIYGPRAQGWVASEEVVGFVAGTVRPLLLATALAIVYAAAARRRPELASIRLPVEPAGTVPRGPARLPLAVAGCGVVVWAYTLTVLTPWLEPLDHNHFFGQLHMQAHDIRLSALLIVVLGFVTAASARGAVVVPSLLGGVALVTADTVVDRTDLGGPTVFIAALAAGLAFLGVAIRLGAWLGRTPPAPETVNRTRLGVAVLAAWCAPVTFANANQLSDAGLMPLGLLLGVGLTAAALLVLAAVALRTLAARWTPPLVALPALGVVLAGTAWLIPDLPALMLVSALAPSTVVLTVAAARWDTSRRWIWLPVTFGALVTGLPAIFAQLMPALLVGSRLMHAAGYGNPPDGMLMLPGALLSGLGPAALLAAAIVRPPTTTGLRTLVSEPAP